MGKQCKRLKYLSCAVVLLLLFVYVANIHVFSEEGDGVLVSGVKLPLLYERINVEGMAMLEQSVVLRLTKSPFGTATYFQNGVNVASSAKLRHSSGKFDVTIYDLAEDGAKTIRLQELVDRSDTISDYYSPLLHTTGVGNSTAQGMRLSTPFGLYEIG